MIGKKLSHYRIIEKIGAGGMGVVYRAHDEQLERDVAIKVLPAALLENENTRKRFRKEALALAKLNHPNIATIYEFGSEEGVDFLVTEYIPGITLDEKLYPGSLSTKECISLGAQLVQGLTAAHEQGVVHRDLKPGNLRVMPDGRLKILDFGLAQLMPREGNADLAATLTQLQEVTGTLPYMAPEQLRGEPSDARTDIWAVGVVLYEMSTGQRPFPDRTGPVLINSILSQQPPAPSSVNRKLPPGFEAIILKSLDKDPALRYQSARELGVDLERVATGAVPVATAASAPSRTLLVAGAIFLVLVGSVSGYFLLHRGKPAPLPVATPFAPPANIVARKSVAVLGFKNLSGRADEAWLSTALSEMLTTELAAGEKLRTVPGENVALMKINLSLPEADSYGKDTLSRIHTNLNADSVVVGSYIPLGKGQIRLDVRIQDALAGETLASLSERGSEDQIDFLVSQAGSAIRDKLGARAVSGAEAAEVKATLPTKTEAARLYFEGLAGLRALDTQTARDLLQKSIAIEPNFALSHGALATVLEHLGEVSRARAEAQKAFDLAGPLSERERLSVEAHLRRLSGERDKAIQIYEKLFEAAPDSLEGGLNLAGALHAAGKDKDATAILEQLRRLPPPARDDPRIDLAETEAIQPLGDYKQMLAFADQAIAKGSTQGARLLVARALGSRCWALQNLHQGVDAIKACEESLRLFTEVHSKNDVAYTANVLGAVLDMQGNHQEAKAKFEQALAIWKQLGNQHDVAQATNNLAIFYDGQGDYVNANKMYEQSLAIARSLDDKLSAAQSLHNIATLLRDRGDLAGALRRFDEASALGHQLGNNSVVLANTLPSCRLFYLMGELVKARTCLEGAEPVLHGTGNKNSMAYDLSIWPKILIEENDLAAARKKLEDLLALRSELGNKAMIAAANQALAALAIEEGLSQEAEGSLRKLVADSGALPDPAAEIEARMSLARALLALGKIQDAAKVIGEGRSTPSKDDQMDFGLRRPVDVARVRAALGHTGEAEKILGTTIAQAKKLGFRAYEYHARLALGEVQLNSGKSAEGRAQLAALEKEARAANFLRIAAQAQKAQESLPKKK